MNFKDFFVERYGGYEKTRELFYHGTSLNNLRSILKQGLVVNPKKRAWDSHNSATFTNPTLMSIPDSIYVTRELMTAIVAATNDEMNYTDVPLIICMDLTNRSLLSDEDNILIDNETVIGNISYDEDILARYFQNYKNRKTDRDAYVHDIITWASPFRKWINSQDIDDRHKQILLEKIPFIYLTILLRQAAHVDSIKNSEKLDIAQTERNFIKMMEWVTTQTRFKTQNKHYGYTEGRVKTNIGFSGSNKIVCVFTLPEYEKKYKSGEDINPYKWDIKYGKLPDETKDELMQRYRLWDIARKDSQI